MKLTPKINLAIKVAARAHAGQLRIGDGVTPYVTHPFAATVILSGYTADDDVLAACLLHDTVEDTSYTLDELGRDFGSQVVESVRQVTETKKRDGEPVPWQERKEGYLKLLETASEGALLVSAADKMHNLISMMDDFALRGDGVWDNFVSGRERFFWFNRAVLTVLQQRLKSPIVTDLSATLDRAESLMNSPVAQP